MNDKKALKSITLISSAICNLNCSFCFLHQNQAYKEYHKLLDAAWKNKEYLANVEKTLQILQYDSTSTECMEIWGGETLIGIQNLKNNLDEIYRIFPNLDTWQFSSNFTINITDLFDFLCALNDIAKEKTTILFQISIDGPPGKISDEGHNGWEYYKTNLINFTKLMNNTKLKNIKMTFSINSVINKETFLNQFSTYEGIYEYMSYMNNFCNEINNLCISESINFLHRFVFPKVATPYTDTVEDGINYAKIIRTWESVYQNEFYSKDTEIDKDGFFDLFGCLKEIDIRQGNPQCRELNDALTINYDGSICECNGSFIHSFQPYIDNIINKNQNEYYEALIHNKMTSYHPHASTTMDIRRKEWFLHNGGYRNTKTIYLQTLMSQLKEAAKNGQALEKYLYDNDVALRHCWLFLNRISCSRNNITDTRNPYITPIGAIRRYFNGVMDIVEEKYNQSIILKIR